MAVSSIVPRVQYTATAGQTEFTVPWKWFADEDIKAYSTEAGEDPVVPRDNLVLNVDYSLTGTGVDDGGTLTLVTAAELDQTITIERDSIGDRPETYDFEVAGTFTVEQLNKNFDKLSMGMQDNNMLIHNRMLLYPAVDTYTQEGDLILPQLDNGFIWKKNSNGKLIAAELVEAEDVSTLRSELLSQSSTAPGTSIIGHYSEQLSVGEDLETFLNRIDLDLRTDLAVDTEADAGSKLVGHYDIETATSTTVYAKLQEVTDPIVYGSFWGFNISNNVTDSDHDLDISAGRCVARGGSALIHDATGMTKRADANWALGTGNGGMASTVTYAADTAYLVFAIMKEDETVDYGFDTSVTAANLLADATDFTTYRRIGAFATDNAGINFSFIETVVGDTKVVKFTNADKFSLANVELNPAPPTNGIPYSTTLNHAPSGIRIEVSLNVFSANWSAGGGAFLYRLWSDLIPEPTYTYNVVDDAGALNCPYQIQSASSATVGVMIHDILTETAFIQAATNEYSGTLDTDNYFRIWVNGWTDYLSMDEFI